MNKRWPAAIGAALLAWYASDSLRHRREGGRGYELQGSLDVRDNEFMRAAEALTGAPISVGNEIDLLINGDEIFPVYLETIREAEQTLNLLTYVYWRGEIASEVAHAVAERARAGVECNVLLDALGAVKMDRDLVRHMTEAGATVRFFRPPKPYAVRRLENRTHRKILVADGSTGLIGGVGIAEEWTGSAQDPDHWRDTHVRVRGPVVRGLEGAFAESWLEATGKVLTTPGHLPSYHEDGSGWPMQVVRSKAGVGDTNVEVLYYLAIASASERIDLTAAYFAPRPAFTEALVAAAERGVAIRILIPGEHIDKPFVRVAGRVSYDTLIEAGVRIWEYRPTMLHAKSLVVDDAWSSVGSVNFDNRSFQLHDEATLCVQSEAFAARLTEQFERDLEVSEEFDLERWRRRPVRARGQESAMKLLRREL